MNVCSYPQSTGRYMQFNFPIFSTLLSGVTAKKLYYKNPTTDVVSSHCIHVISYSSFTFSLQSVGKPLPPPAAAKPFK